MTKITRRDFIGTTTASAAGMVVMPHIAEVFNHPADKKLFAHLPTVPFGAVYFRKSNPPREDWEVDYREAAKIGINAFRHWFMWSAIEVKPGVYDWDDYDRQLDLAAKYGIKTIVAEILGTAPEWAFREYPHAMVENASGHKAHSRYTAASAVSGSPGLCLDNEDVRVHAQAFLEALADRYKDHPGMGAYNLWNEQNMNGGAGSCWCDASAKKFRTWVRDRYKDLDVLAKAWNRYSYRDWEDIEIPRHNTFYGDALDWYMYRIENSHRLLKWRVDTLRSRDPHNPITCHGIPEGMIKRIGPGTYNVWKAGELVDIYGCTGGHNFQEWSKYRWQHWIQMDLTRAGAKGKPWWVAEMPSGYAWRYHGRTQEQGRYLTAGDVRLYSLTSLASGATGVFSPRWRPLQNGKFAGSFAYCNMDGSHTDRSAMAGEIATWANDKEQEPLWKARPVRGQVGIIVVPESQIQVYLLEGSTTHYYHATAGAYQGFLFNNIQADFIPVEEIADSPYPMLYLPHPLMLPREVAEAVKAYVRKGGTLVSEGCPAYYGDHGRAGETQPNYGLDELFGVREERVEFTPVLLENMRFEAEGTSVAGGVYLQAYRPAGGRVLGRFEDGTAAMVAHGFGKGKSLLVGTSPGYGFYESRDDPESRSFFAKVFRNAGVAQDVRCSDHRLVARLHNGNGYRVLWIVNSAREEIDARLELAGKWGSFDKMETIVSRGSVSGRGQSLEVRVPSRDVLIVKMT